MLTFIDGEREVEVTVFFEPNGYRVRVPGGEVAATGAFDADGRLRANLGGRRLSAGIVRQGAEITVLMGERVHHLRRRDLLAAGEADAGAGGALAAPMPGKVIQVMVEAGQEVARGAALMVLEAMKMEHSIRAPADGVVREVRFSAGETVDEGAELIDFEASE